MKERACKTCRRIIKAQVCPTCKTYTLSYDYDGLVIINDYQNSQIAEKLNINENGKYALKVR
ncbi:MAG: DNA-directed RNA polymerase subunit E'' [Candidatus Odinarchaeum yellowstonii]|uniref:Transcription elongation factor Spt4 n=1 Tax=Odinarchaeota yellowstonii (strain LCB_4) TaxID=1841599 RepID=A0AAF0IAP5_ODILC|nr:MAG: DNA-directed RNA polymerase subunit E'' [Candidatus Odinarchaeum yellowstonii]